MNEEQFREYKRNEKIIGDTYELKESLNQILEKLTKIAEGSKIEKK